MVTNESESSQGVAQSLFKHNVNRGVTNLDPRGLV